jgi:hypothetical protein
MWREHNMWSIVEKTQYCGENTITIRLQTTNSRK